jgi:hypothetical protein
MPSNVPNVAATVILLMDPDRARMRQSNGVDLGRTVP